MRKVRHRELESHSQCEARVDLELGSVVVLVQLGSERPCPLPAVSLCPRADPRLCQCDTLPSNKAFQGSGFDSVAQRREGEGHSLAPFLHPLRIPDLRFCKPPQWWAPRRSGGRGERGVLGEATPWYLQTSSPVLPPYFPNPIPQIWPVSLPTACPALWVMLGDRQLREQVEEGAEGGEEGGREAGALLDCC